MERYYIALYELGIKNGLLIKAITEYSSDTIISLFEGNTNIFLTNIEWLPYKEIFEDSFKVADGLKKADEIIMLNEKNEIHAQDTILSMLCKRKDTKVVLLNLILGIKYGKTRCFLTLLGRSSPL